MYMYQENLDPIVGGNSANKNEEQAKKRHDWLSNSVDVTAKTRTFPVQRPPLSHWTRSVNLIAPFPFPSSPHPSNTSSSLFSNPEFNKHSIINITTITQ